MSAIKTDTKNVPKVVVLMFEIDFGWVYIDLDGLKSYSNLSVKRANLPRGRIYICANSLLYNSVLGILAKS